MLDTPEMLDTLDTRDAIMNDRKCKGHSNGIATEGV